MESGRMYDRSVILFTAAAPIESEKLAYWVRVKGIMQQLFDVDAIVVVPAGNYAQQKNRVQIDTLPARWTSPSFPLIVVGAVTDLRYPAKFTQGPHGVTVNAPGVNVLCAGSEKASGTSAAAAMVRHPGHHQHSMEFSDRSV